MSKDVNRYYYPKSNLLLWPFLIFFGPICIGAFFYGFINYIKFAFGFQYDHRFPASLEYIFFSIMGIVFVFSVIKAIFTKNFFFSINHNKFIVLNLDKIIIKSFNLNNEYEKNKSFKSIYLKFYDYNFFEILLLYYNYPLYVFFAPNGIRLNLLLLSEVVDEI